MKSLKVCAISALATGSLAAQGIFNVSPNDGITESLPLEFNAKLNFGYDDNVTPTVRANRGDSASYTSLSVGANYLNLGPQTNVDFNIKLGILHYLDNVENSQVKDTYSDSRGLLNISHNVSERLRFSTRNYVFYGLEPDYTYGAVNDRTNDEYLFFSTDNSVGYKWTERLGTYTGVKYDTLNYDSNDSRNDRQNFTAYNQFRYVLSPQAVGTLDYRYRFTDVKGGLDSDNHKVLVGTEYRINRTAVLVAKAGVQYRKVKTRDAQTDPTFEVGYQQRVNNQFRVRGSIAYDVNDYGTSFFGSNFENNRAFRFSLAGDYHLSQQLFFTGGVNYVANEYYGGRPDDEVDVFNCHIGATYQFIDNFSANVHYNYTNSNDAGDTLARDYDRNRVQAGLTYTF
ncbi:outer membrane beta-barrel protein [Rubritalea tangerina]|uniref:Outer membrane beta-barrel protein n=1 Tax=Rubritalea tangerina TaxID=430798 RepID=A0ABW4ZCN5_9BACT